MSQRNASAHLHGVAATLALLLGSAAAVAAPAKMQAIVQTGTGGPEVLELQEVGTPRPAAGQVLIRVYAAGVNPVDWKLRMGARPPANAAGPNIPGFDVAGIVDSVGTGVTGFKAGDAVFARVNGAYAQYALADIDSIVAKPKVFTYEQAAGIPVAGVAGYRAAEEAHIEAGQRVAVIGAAGGAGSVAVEVAKSKGAKVIASGHSSQKQYLQSLGVDEFVAYDKEDVVAKIRDVDAVLNMVESQATSSLAYVRKGGWFTSIAGGPGDDKCSAAGVNCLVIGRDYRGAVTQANSLRALAALADQGKYHVKVTRTFPLAEAPAAQELNRNSDTIGKIVIVVDPKAAQR